MSQRWSVIGWLPVVVLTACVASQKGEPTALRPAPDRLLTRGEIRVAEANLQGFGFDPGPIDGSFTAETQAAVRAFQARYGLTVSGLLDRATRRELLPGLDSERNF
jgi:peptidoglycan hydrolase-like protein with peptidoglycan-binding domain